MILGAILFIRRRRQRASNVVDWESVRASSFGGNLNDSNPTDAPYSVQLPPAMSQFTPANPPTVSPRLLLQTPSATLSEAFTLHNGSTPSIQDPFADPQVVARRTIIRESLSPTIRASENPFADPVYERDSGHESAESQDSGLGTILSEFDSLHSEFADALMHPPAPLMPGNANVNRLSAASSNAESMTRPDSSVSTDTWFGLCR